SKAPAMVCRPLTRRVLVSFHGYSRLQVEGLRVEGNLSCRVAANKGNPASSHHHSLWAALPEGIAAHKQVLKLDGLGGMAGRVKIASDGRRTGDGCRIEACAETVRRL